MKTEAQCAIMVNSEKKEGTMTKNKSSAIDVDDPRRENALIGYQMAINLWTYQGAQGWARFNVLLFVNGTIIGIIGLIMTSGDPQPFATGFLALVGLLLCCFWLPVIHREDEYASYYVRSARELEEKYLSDSVKTVSRGRLFGDGKVVTIETSAEPSSQVQMGWLARRWRAKSAAKMILVVLTLSYIVTIILHCPCFAYVSPFIPP